MGEVNGNSSVSSRRNSYKIGRKDADGAVMMVAKAEAGGMGSTHPGLVSSNLIDYTQQCSWISQVEENHLYCISLHFALQLIFNSFSRNPLKWQISNIPIIH